MGGLDLGSDDVDVELTDADMKDPALLVGNTTACHRILNSDALHRRC